MIINKQVPIWTPPTPPLPFIESAVGGGETKKGLSDFHDFSHKKREVGKIGFFKKKGLPYH